MTIVMPPAAAGPRGAERQGVADLPIRGVVRPIEQASLSTEYPMRVQTLAVREGQSFRRGDVLVAFDCRRQRAELRSMAAQMREAELVLSTSVSLDRHNAIGRNDVEIARARLERVTAEKNGLEARIQDCEITAPFDGRVVELSIRQLEFTAAQRPFLVVIDDSDVELDLIVPASLLSGVRVGDGLVFQVDELEGSALTARVKTIGAAVDPVSKSVRLIAEVVDKPPALVAGMSGTAVMKARP